MGYWGGGGRVLKSYNLLHVCRFFCFQTKDLFFILADEEEEGRGVVTKLVTFCGRNENKESVTFSRDGIFCMKKIF